MARTDDEARAKMIRAFRSFGLHSMSLVAVEEGQDPNLVDQNHVRKEQNQLDDSGGAGLTGIMP